MAGMLVAVIAVIAVVVIAFLLMSQRAATPAPGGANIDVNLPAGEGGAQ